MNDARCPECLETEIDELERELVDAGLRWTLECVECGHVWSIVA